MKLTTSLSLALVSMLALALPACQEPAEDDSEALVGQAEQDGVGEAEQDRAVGTAEQDGAVGTAEQAVTGTCVPAYIRYYTYSDATGSYHWDVTFNFDQNKWYVDEKKIGVNQRKQYVLTPDWTYCPSHIGASDAISLKYGTTTMNGFQNCLSATVEEVHMPDKQRELYFDHEFFGCQP